MITVEISKEERDLWRFEASDECGTPSDEDERIFRLLNALETTEALLDGSVQETRANFSAVYQACTEIIPDIKAKLADAEARAEKAEAEVARLREKLESALDKIENIQDSDSYGVWEGVCHACGICAGYPEDWEPTDDHNCRVMLELWADGESLPWEAARKAVDAGEE